MRQALVTALFRLPAAWPKLSCAVMSASVPRPRRTGSRRTGSRRTGTVLAAAALAAAAPLLAGCGATATMGTAAGTAAGGGAGYVSGDGRALTFPVGHRQPAPPVRGRTLNGSSCDLATLRGTVVVLNIWGSWCPPCRKEAPSLERVWRATKSRGVRFVGLDSRDVDSRAAAFQRAFGLTYPSVVDPDGLVQLGFRGQLAAAALPTTYIIDRSGKVAARATDQLTDTRLRALLDPVLAEPATPAKTP